jgi:hypothetical protein
MAWHQRQAKDPLLRQRYLPIALVAATYRRIWFSELQ